MGTSRSSRLRLAIVLGGAALAALLAAGSAAASITVANTNDTGPGSLRQALAEAPTGETIVLPAGTYTLTSASLIITKSVTISGHGAGDTIIRGGNPFTLIETIKAGDVTISGVTIRDGKLTGSGPMGAGLISVETNLTLREDVVTNNVLDANGAPGVNGGFAEGAGIVTVKGQFNLIDSKVTDNTATAIGGSGAAGGTAEGAGLLLVGPFKIQNSTISGNVADARGGQGTSNAAQDGGTVDASGFVAVNNEATTSSIAGSTVSNNIADASGGPGGEKGTIQGGAMLEVTSATPIAFANVTVANNVARATGEAAGKSDLGGGLLVVANSPGSLSVLDSTFSGNVLEAAGGGTSEGGNIYSVGAVSFGDTIVANGVGPTGSENCGAAPAIVSLGFNLDSLNQCGFTAAGDQANKNPLLGPLQSNGGPAQIIAPASSSPAIDQGKSFGLTIDGRGILRPIDLPTIPNPVVAGADGSDIGAFELQPSNDLKLGKLKKNKAKGTATLEVILPGPSAGSLILGGKGLKSQTKAIAGQTSLKLRVVAKGGTLKALRKKGKRKVKIKVTYTPTGNAALTKTRSTKLIRKPKKHPKRPER